ncbi:MAG: hypothetical protein Roseis2KO_34910 [Roseivirga sp.]
MIQPDGVSLTSWSNELPLTRLSLVQAKITGIRIVLETMFFITLGDWGTLFIVNKVVCLDRHNGGVEKSL